MKQLITHYATPEVRVYLISLAYFSAMTVFAMWYV